MCGSNCKSRTIRKTNLIEEVARKTEYVATQLEDLFAYKHVGDIRQCGLMVGIELVKNKETKEAFEWTERVGVQVCKRSRELGMILRPLGNTIVFMPLLLLQLMRLMICYVFCIKQSRMLRRRIMSGFYNSNGY